MRVGACLGNPLYDSIVHNFTIVLIKSPLNSSSRINHIQHGICIMFLSCGKHDDVKPLGNFVQELIEKRSLVYVETDVLVISQLFVHPSHPNHPTTPTIVIPMLSNEGTIKERSEYRQE